MQLFCRLVYFTSWAFILLVSLLALTIWLSPLEWADASMRESFEQCLFPGLPIAFLLTLARLGYRDLPRKQRIRIALRKIMILVLAGVFFLLYGMASFGAGMCGTTTGETLLINRADPTQKVVKRYFGCGATDSSPDRVHLARERQMGSWFRYYVSVDSSRVKRNEWVPVDH